MEEPMMRETAEQTNQFREAAAGLAEVRKVQTSRFGEIEVAEDRVLTMTTPFLGFPDSRHFVLRPHHGDSPFMWLQSLEDPGLAFVVIQPALLAADYRPGIPRSAREELEAESGDQLELLVILTIPQGKPQEITANLLGPVAINVGKRLLKQILLDPSLYDPCWPVLRKG